MSKNVGYGDKLARGAVRATYPATEGGISADKWAQAFDDFDLEKFKNGPTPTDPDAKKANSSGGFAEPPVEISQEEKDFIADAEADRLEQSVHD